MLDGVSHYLLAATHTAPPPGGAAPQRWFWFWFLRSASCHFLAGLSVTELQPWSRRAASGLTLVFLRRLTFIWAD